MFRRAAFAAPLALLCCALSAAQTVLTADRVVELAERQNPEVLIASTKGDTSH